MRVIVISGASVGIGAEIARLIVGGMSRRQREVAMTAKGKVGRFLTLLVPGLSAKPAIATVTDDARPR